MAIIIWIKFIKFFTNTNNIIHVHVHFLILIKCRKCVNEINYLTTNIQVYSKLSSSHIV